MEFSTYLDMCQCCLRSYGEGNVIITEEIQQIFHNFVNFQLQSGLVCQRCHKYLLTFHRFKHEISEKHLKLQQHPDQYEIPIKEELIDSIDPIAMVNVSLIAEDKPKVAISVGRVNLRKALAREKKESSNYVKSKASAPTKAAPLQLKLDPTQPNRAFCPICSKLLTRTSVAAHIKYHHNKERPQMCEVCSKTYPNNHDLMIHMRHHTGERPFCCDKCGRTFTSKKNLVGHFKLVHLKFRKVVDFKVPCPICSKMFPFPAKMEAHKRAAHPGGRDDGIRVNPTTNNYHCPSCDAEFRTKFRIDNHTCMMTGRGGDITSTCPICATVTKNRDGLIKHLQEHGERLDGTKWRCKICGSIVKDKIAVHIENVHAKEPSVCHICQKQLKNRKSLWQHIWLSHKDGRRKRQERRRAGDQEHDESE